MPELTDINGVGPAKAETLRENGYESVEDVANADEEELEAVDGVGDDRALEFIVSAQNLVDDDAVEDEAEVAEDEFDLTPSEVSEEVESGQNEDEDDVQPQQKPIVEDETDAGEGEPVVAEESNEGPHDVAIDFDDRLQFHTFHEALMNRHESAYSSDQSSADAMQKCLDGLDSFDGVSYELTEEELNELHSAILQQRVDYQGANLIEHMDALRAVEEKVDYLRQEYLF